MVEIKSNFPGKYKDITCETMCGEDETMNHILECNILNEGVNIGDNIKFSTIHTGSIQEKLEIMNIYKRNIMKRNNIIQNRRKNFQNNNQ